MNGRKEQEIERLLNYPDPPKRDSREKPGVLLSDEIEYYAKTYKMIHPFIEENLAPASYNVSVGDEYAVGGEVKTLQDELGKNMIKIPPFQVAVIKTKETFNLPCFIIGRWNIRVTCAYKGLLWVGGPQVDPSYRGHLFCPIYNLSDKIVELELGAKIATMDFVKTTPFVEGKCKEFPLPSLDRRVLFENYEPDKLKSGLIEIAQDSITKIKEKTENDVQDLGDKVKRFGTRLDISTGGFLTFIAIIVAVLSIVITSKPQIPDYPDPIWIYVNTAFSISALILAILVLALTRRSK